MKRVLLIEDNTDIRENMAEILELSGYEVVAAADGKEGVTAAMQNIPDIVVCDIMMPVLDGYGVIHMLQKNPETRHVPFIFLTAKAERSEIRKGMELGADDYLTKPFNGTELLNAIESRLKKNELMKKDLGTGIEGVKALIAEVEQKDMHQLVHDAGETHTYKKKQVIYDEHKKPHYLFYIESGKVKTYKKNDDGKELVTAIYNTGDFFGYIAILEQTGYKETAEALEDCEVSVVSRAGFEQLLYNSPDALRKMIQLLAHNITEKETQLLGLAYNSLRKKVANALLAVAAKYITDSSSTTAIDISRDNLATIAGTAKESLIRTLSDFKDEGMIEIIKGDILIKDSKRLQQLIN